MRVLRGYSQLAIACWFGLASAAEPAYKLPDIGSSAATVMSPSDLHDYGAEMLRELRSYDMVLDDPLVADYLGAIGYRLVSMSDRPEQPFTFFVVRDNTINAFAAPGGFVAVNSGLIVNMDRVDELAAVLAHEISHITQQHLLRAFESQQKMSIPVMLAMLGIMIASAGRSDDTGQAAIVTGTSILQQHAINFTRQDEAEADRVGIQTLARAGFDPNAMAEAFQTLQRITRVNSTEIPPYLIDHPVDTLRIADAKARAAQLGCPVAQQVPPPGPVAPARSGALDLSLPRDYSFLSDANAPDTGSGTDAATTLSVAAKGHAGALPTVTVEACRDRDPAAQSYFLLMRERTRVLSSDNPSTTLGYYTRNLHDDKAFNTLANRYGHALALLRSNQAQSAMAELAPLAAQHPDSAVLRLALAKATAKSGGRDVARHEYESIYRDFPGNRAVVLMYADALLDAGDAAGARRVQEILRPLLDRNPADPDLQQSFGRACALAGDTVRAAEAYAEAAFLNGHAEDALNQLKRLATRQDLDYYQRSRIDARIAQLTPIVLEARKRDSDSPPDSLLPAWH